MASLSVGQTPAAPAAKQQCSLSLGQSPEIRGVRLGMTADKLLVAFPEIDNRTSIERAVQESKRTYSYGAGTFSLNQDPGAANPKFTGVSRIGVEILDERVTSFYVAYTGPEWKNVEQFIARLSEAFKLPGADSWTPEPGDSNRSLECNGFVIDVHAGGYNSVRVRVPSATRIVEDRREAVKEKARVAFKP
jgi:hypothetical protein